MELGPVLILTLFKKQVKVVGSLIAKPKLYHAFENRVPVSQYVSRF